MPCEEPLVSVLFLEFLGLFIAMANVLLCLMAQRYVFSSMCTSDSPFFETKSLFFFKSPVIRDFYLLLQSKTIDRWNNDIATNQNQNSSTISGDVV